jgi:hypothetical protein
MVTEHVGLLGRDERAFGRMSWMVSEPTWSVREKHLEEFVLGLMDTRVGCFVGPRLPRCYNEASFTAVCYSLRLEEWAYALLYYGPQTCPRAKGEKVKDATQWIREGGIIARH